ncbi:salicylate carboxymethyltransferase-like [Olea europaea subsp. europaea]|uniref:Salicylate carboxymethyltransferase-like n=2 Tax=Olea europaea subsp. europaea TaxID=158383 RepID=A0A8S0T771_OLEEU|nr:salicylate carboxymethyltransferase-like [Olea europaea subsp. europaea]
MDLEKVFHMKGGRGETSYSENSSLQKKAADKVNHITVEAIKEMFLESKPMSLCIADLGCSSGPNSLSNIKELVNAIERESRKLFERAPEFRVYLNDLPTNDFNTIFQALPDLYRELKKGRNHGSPSIYIAGYPGTFYGRLFPDKCLHFIYSSNSLHWLSRVPPGIYNEQGDSTNRKSIYISENSPPKVAQAYFEQFKQDFSLFLQSRSDEVVVGGRMVLILLGRNGPNYVDRGTAFLWEILYRSLAILVSKGEVEEEKLDSYEVHFYAPSKEELEDEIRKEGSFKLDRFEMFEIEKDTGNSSTSYGRAVAMTVRSIQESMISHHFGEAILDNLFEEYGRLVDEEMAKEDIRSISFVLVLQKL